jgi:hypothetical protein
LLSFVRRFSPSRTRWQPTINASLIRVVPSEAQVAKWEAVAREKNPPFVDSKSMALNDAVVALLEITPAETELLNAARGHFIDKLRTLEIENAHVLEKKDGSEVIVVSPFDRRPLLNEFRASVAAKLGNEIAKLCADMMQYDATLALENAEMRVHIEKHLRHGDEVVFKRQYRNRKNTFIYIEHLPLDGEVGVRNDHLFSAKPGLPRKTEPPSQTPN